MATLKKEVRYLNKDFTQFRANLVEFAKNYFPNNYSDFNESSPGMMFMEMSAYVGDVLSYYTDNQLKESLLNFAGEDANVMAIANVLGYKSKNRIPSYATLDVYQLLPAKTTPSGSKVPDYDYALTIKENMQVRSELKNIEFRSLNLLNFRASSSYNPTEVSVYQISGNTPQYFLLKKSRNAISSTINTTSFSFGAPQQFATINIQANNIVKILDITDSDGNIWYEVDHLGQEMVFDSIKNTNINDPNKIDDTPFLLKLKKVARRFATRFTSLSNLQIQFGAGSPSDTTEEITPNPNNVGIGLPFKKDKLTTAFSPLNFLYTGTYGISPANTTLTVRYLTGGGVNSNITANSLTNLNTGNIKFNNFNLNSTTSNYEERKAPAGNEYRLRSYGDD